MATHDWLRPPRQVLATFLAVAALSTGALGWLTWRVLDQDAQLQAQRQRLDLEQAADAAVGAMQQTFASLLALTGRPVDPKSPIPRGVSWVTVREGVGTTIRPQGLPYVPVVPSRTEAPDEVFALAQRAEFAPEGSRVSALRAYEQLARIPEQAVRAGALARAARLHRTLKNTDAALQAYTALAGIGDEVGVLGYAPSLLAAIGTVTALAEAGRGPELRRATEDLSLDLGRGRWQLTEVEYEAQRMFLREHLPADPPVDRHAVAAAAAVTALWSNRASSQSSSGRLLNTSSGPVLAAWQEGSDGLTAALAGPSLVETMCSIGVREGFKCALTDLAGALVVGPAPQGLVETRSATVSKLPWTVQIFRDPAVRPESSPSRLPLLSMFGALAVVLGAGWYFIIRSIAREVRVARLQTDFVAAVSHEFRSPLTSLGHIAEMLAENRITSAELRQQSYGVLVRDTDRLRRLVETLLDLGRFDGGATAFRKEPANLSQLALATVAEFQERVHIEGYTIHCDVTPGELPVHVDREALSRALWNLLDNAVKYSPGGGTIYVQVTRDDARGVIAVLDEGIGIPAHERATIFDRFVRGDESRLRQIRGTGIGLALVRQIVRGHGGEVDVASELGRGSTFRVVLPLSPSGRQSDVQTLQAARS